MKWIIAVVFAAVCFGAETRISVSPQGAASLKAMTGKRIPGVQILGVTMCSDVRGGDVYQALNHVGIATIMPRNAVAIVEQTVNRNWRKTALDAGKIGALLAAAFTTSGVIAASPKVASALIVGHQVGDQVGELVRQRLPDPRGLLDALIDPEGRIEAGAGCKVGMVMVVFDKNTKAQDLAVN